MNHNIYMQSLVDILDSIDRIEVFVGSPKLFSNYDSNILIQQAVERNLEIIGESCKRLLVQKPDITISNIRSIINTRNKISHGYDEIQNSEIRNIITRHLPLLKSEIEFLLEN
jgi:uncharacterized protein with HEPN domain